MALVEVIRGRYEGPDSIGSRIRSGLRGARTTLPMEEDDWVRVSSIGSMCPREEILCGQTGVVREEGYDGLVTIVFEMGHGVHWMMQNKVLPLVCTLIGSWRCTYCGETYGSRGTQLVARPERCIRCGAIAAEAPRQNGRPVGDVQADAFLYVEEWVGDSEHRIGGHPDGQYVITDDGIYRDEEPTLIELKSANDRNFTMMKKAPDFVHIIQTQVYMWLAGYRKAKIIYINKNGYGPTAMCEHDLEYDAETVERVQAAVKDIRAGLRGEGLPTRTMCANVSCSRAIRCKVADLCFKESSK